MLVLILQKSSQTQRNKFFFPEWYAAKGSYSTVKAALIHGPISDIL